MTGVLAAIGLGYLMGSAPFGLLITRLAGAGDIRKIGSGNIGATNVLRTGRKGLALATLLADLVKGWAPVFLCAQWFGPAAGLAAGVAAVIGHCFPIWLGFKGGKGVATAAGVILAVSALCFAAVLLVFALALGSKRIVSLASMAAAGAAPIAAFFLIGANAALALALLAAVVIYRHRGNIERLRAGTEPTVW